jgi:hypothetical protein
LSVEEFHSVRAGETEAAAVAEIEDADRGAEGGEFSRGITVVSDDFGVVDGCEAGAECGVKFVKGKRCHGVRIPGAGVLASYGRAASRPYRVLG